MCGRRQTLMLLILTKRGTRGSSSASANSLLSQHKLSSVSLVLLLESMRYLIESFASFGSDTWCFGDDKEKVTTLCGQLNRNIGRTLVFLFSLGGFRNEAVRHYGVFSCWILQSWYLDLQTYEANMSFRSLKFFSTYFLPVSQSWGQILLGKDES